MNDDFVTYDIATKLRDNGFNERCEYTFYNHYRVKDEIYDKHPGLSDDGYEDLRKKYGGPYEDDEVYGYYIEPLKLYSRNSTIGINPMTKTKVATNELCPCPEIPQVLKWLRKEKKIVISIFPHPCGWQADIYKDVHQYYDSEAECYLMHYYKEKTEISHSYNWLEIYCIRYVLDNLIKL